MAERKISAEPVNKNFPFFEEGKLSEIFLIAGI
ncbi:MAG: hypothetical protein ACJAS9_000965 [Polaribacter sp.]